ncbi:MAG: pentapeptide repeat-containing protein [Terracidiphilus sp.]
MADEQEITSDENARAKRESVEVGCPITMGEGGKRCGRPLHDAPDGVDEKPVCLMHSKDSQKQSGPFFDAFLREFERILKEAGEEEAHFEQFVFPFLNLGGRTFHAICRFESAVFAHGARFLIATFVQKAVFWRATFSKNTEFRGVTFKQNAYFNEATFTQNADFGRVAFMQDGDFSEATFEQIADFKEATFMHNADFGGVTFKQMLCFTGTTFNGTANWRRSRFLDQAEFRHTKFDPQVEGEPSAVFALANFSKPGEVIFDDIDLSRALFHNCDVSQVWFTSSVSWARRKYNRGVAVFEETISVNTPGRAGGLIV